MTDSRSDDGWDGVWRNAVRGFIGLVMIGIGYWICVMRHGDAIELRKKVWQQESRLAEIWAERQAITESWTPERRTADYNSCLKELESCRKGTAASPAD
jgi:hypothetical protein